MRFGISTHLFHDSRLDRTHLAQIAAAGFDVIEIFATRSHFDYHDEGAIAALSTWLADTGLTLGSVHAPIALAMSAGQLRDVLSNASSDNTARQAAVRETEAALQMARQIPFETLVVHLGTPAAKSGAGDNTRSSALRSAEEICRAAAPLGVKVAFEVIPNEISTPAALVDLLEQDLDAPLTGLCLDFGHAHLMGDVADAVEIAAEHVDRHAHSRQPRSRRRSPCAVSREDQLGRGVDDDAEDRVRGHVPDGARQHRFTGGGTRGSAARASAL